MKRLLTLAATALLCIAGAGLASAEVEPTVHHSSATGHTTQTPPAASMKAVDNPVPLWTADDGPTIVTRMVGLPGLTGTQPADDPGEWGDTKITSQDMVTVYRYITDRLPTPDWDLVLGALAGAPPIAADGFNQYFSIPDGIPHTTWAIKQGWGTSDSGAAAS